MQTLHSVRVLTRAVSIACSAALILLVAMDVQAQAPSHLVTIETGELPIILSAPHGGRESIPGVPVRRGKGVRLFRTKTDSFTDSLTEKLADAIERQLGRRPYVVIARFHRKYVDANRPARAAFESSAAESTYETYHQALNDARDDVIQRWGRGLLLDIHGQAAAPMTIFRGTQNGATTTHLVQRFGQPSLVGETSLFGHFAKHGLKVFPDVGAEDRENPKYNGGHIVATYGSRQGGTLDAIQLELGWDLRAPGASAATAEKLSLAIAAFANDYLPNAGDTESNTP